MRKKRKINFKHMGVNYEPDVSELYSWCPALHDHYDFVLSETPDFVIYSIFDGKSMWVDNENMYHCTMPVLENDCIKIFYTGENCRPDMQACDYAFTFDYDEELKSERHYRLPNYARMGAGEDLLKSYYDVDQVFERKSKFCNFVYRHDVPLRNDFFKKLSDYKRVDAPAPCMQNMPQLTYVNNVNNEKVEFIREYKFTIAFEHSSYPGYTTEKLYHAMLGDSVAIYWGNPLVSRDFNEKSFVNCHDYESIDAVIDKIIELDNDDDLYRSYLSEAWYNDNQLSPYVDQNRLLQQMHRIFS